MLGAETASVTKIDVLLLGIYLCVTRHSER